MCRKKFFRCLVWCLEKGGWQAGLGRGGAKIAARRRPKSHVPSGRTFGYARAIDGSCAAELRPAASTDHLEEKPMRVDVTTLQYASALGGFDASPLDAILDWDGVFGFGDRDRVSNSKFWCR